MKNNVLWIVALVFLVSCQDKAPSEPVGEVETGIVNSQPIAKEAHVKVEEPDEHAITDIVAKEAAEDKMLVTEVSKSTSKSSASETQIKVQVNKGVEVSKAEQPEVKVVSKSDAPKQEKHVKDVVDKPAATKLTSKVVAPLTQGKGPIKSEPNPAPSDKMIKAEPVVAISMDAAKAKSLTKKCKSCHAMDKDKVGPSWKKIQTSYGSADTLAAVFESGFAVESRKVAMSDAKWKKKAKTMTGQYKKLIKKQVNKGKFTYKELAEAIFAK